METLLLSQQQQCEVESLPRLRPLRQGLPTKPSTYLGRTGVESDADSALDDDESKGDDDDDVSVSDGSDAGSSSSPSVNDGGHNSSSDGDE